MIDLHLAYEDTESDDDSYYASTDDGMDFTSEEDRMYEWAYEEMERRHMEREGWSE